MNQNINELSTNIHNIEQPEKFFHELYTNFNERNIEAVIASLTDDVQWANGMEGGYVYGQAGVRNYWTRQFTMVSANVTPRKIEKENTVFKIEVHQVVHDMNGQLLADEIVHHLFHFKENKISLFEIES
jgi:ketosteroid isomerase-like protein